MTDIFGAPIAEIEQETLRLANSVNIKVRQISMQRLIKETAQYSNERNARAIENGKVFALDPCANEDTLPLKVRRAIAAHARHEYSNYDKAWQQFQALPGGTEAYQVIRKKTEKAILAAYPKLKGGVGTSQSPFTQFRISPELTEEEKEVLLAPLSADERTTVNHALTQEITITVLPEKGFTVGADAVSTRHIVATAFRRQSNFDEVATKYLNHPGFAVAWDVLYRATAHEFARHYPAEARAFHQYANAKLRDWKKYDFTLRWFIGETERVADLSVIRTNSTHLIRTGKAYAPVGVSKEIDHDALLEACLKEFTSYTYEVDAVYRSELLANPQARLTVMEQTLDAIATVHTMLAGAVAKRKRVLQEECTKQLRDMAWVAAETERIRKQQAIQEKEVREAQLRQAKEREEREQQEREAREQRAQEREERKREAQEREERERRAQGPVSVPGFGLLDAEHQRKLIRRLVSSHPDHAIYMRQASKAAPEELEAVTLFGIYQLHIAIKEKYPELSDAIAMEVQRRETDLAAEIRLGQKVGKKTKGKYEKHPALTQKTKADIREVRQLASSHPSVPNHNRTWGLFPIEQQLEKRIEAMKAVHGDVGREHPRLANAVKVEIASQEARMRNKAARRERG